MTAHPAPLPAGWGTQTPGLTVAAAVRRPGVAPGTLPTWDRRCGIGPDGHAPGRHRRYSSADLPRLETMQRALVRGVSPADAPRYAPAVDPPGATRFPGPPEGTVTSPPVPLCGARRRVAVGDRWPEAPGLGHRYVGADLPADARASAAQPTAPAAVVMWSQGTGTADPAMVKAMPRIRPRYRTFTARSGWDGATLPHRTGRLGRREAPSSRSPRRS